jgi:hypothetical protein
MKRQVAMTLFKNKLIAPFSDEWGIWTDAQVPEYLFSLCRHSYGNIIA